MANALAVFLPVTVGVTALTIDPSGVNYHKFASVSIQADPLNTGQIYVGNSLLSTTRYARVLNPGDSFTIAGSAIDTTKIFVLGSAAGQIAHPSAS